MTPTSPEASFDPTAPLVALRGVGPVRARALAERGYHNLEELLFHLPLRYEDRRSLATVADLTVPGARTVQGRLSKVKRVFVRRRRFSMVRGQLEDETGKVPVVWFNRPYLANQVEDGAEYILHGEVRQRSERWELMNPTVERADQVSVTRGVVPIYPAVAGVGPSALRSLLGQVLDGVGLPAAVPEWLPPALLERHRLPPLGEALLDLHRPSEEADVEELNARSSAAHRRLAYGELLVQQIELGLSRADVRNAAKEHRYLSRARLEEACAGVPPFELTRAQRRVLGEILDDLASERPMLRLLQGDVGCGKTIIAVLAMVAAVESGHQAALMAPTEILAEQHLESMRKLLPRGMRLAHLTGSSADAAATRADLAAGRAQIVVGTHALIQKSVHFDRLGLVVVDEQHRFGVRQRRALQHKGARPDLLVMTATPIPRSLSLTLYGDLDLSVIDELPPGRKPVDTRVVPEAKRREVCSWLDRRLESGSQAYIVLPLIGESETVAAASIERLGERWRQKLQRHAPAVLHGRTPADERRAILGDFSGGRARVLIATTVVEVGLDVAHADVMILESAERFGLSQLHQLRGRVGRSERASHCVALHGELTPEADRRLTAFAATTDGFELAEADLEIRGPGDLLGTRQSGAPLFRAADLLRDRGLLEEVRNDARELLRDRSDVSPLLWRQIEERDRYDDLAGG